MLMHVKFFNSTEIKLVLSDLSVTPAGGKWYLHVPQVREPLFASEKLKPQEEKPTVHLALKLNFKKSASQIMYQVIPQF